VSCFTRTDWAPCLPPDATTEAVTRARASEDEAFADVLGDRGAVVSLSLPDAPLRPDWRFTGGQLQGPDPGLTARLIAELQRSLRRLRSPGAAWAIPLALDHRDHLIARTAGLLAAGGAPFFFYEEVPYVLKMTTRDLENHVAAVAALVHQPLRERAFPAAGEMTPWLRAAACYPSQLSGEAAASLSRMVRARGPERLWTTETFEGYLEQAVGRDGHPRLEACARPAETSAADRETLAALADEEMAAASRRATAGPA
jgi:hypothetical protein